MTKINCCNCHTGVSLDQARVCGQCGKMMCGRCAEQNCGLCPDCYTELSYFQ